MTQRHRKARGSLEQRAGSWYVRMPEQQADPQTGEVRRVRRRHYLGSTNDIRSEADARRAADAWLGRNQPWQLQHGESIGFAAYVEQFLEQHAALFRKASRRNYRTRLHKHLVPQFGGMPLWRISPAEIRPVLARLRAKGLRRSTLRGIRSTLLQVLRQARIDGYDAQEIERWLVKLPEEDIAEREQRFISEAELEQILAGSDFPWRALWAVLGLAGLRISEALGLTWQHVDLGDAPMLHIRQGAADGQLLPLKTKTSRADLPMDPRLAKILTAYSGVWRPNAAGLLFATSTGRPKSYRDVRLYQLLPLLKRLGLPPAGFHAFRHGLPRRLFAAGCSASVVQRLLRHGSMRMTENYTHATAEDLRAAINSAANGRIRAPNGPHGNHAAQEIQP